MKKTVLIIGIIALLLNIVLGLLITKYIMFNVCLNSIVIILTTVLILIVGSQKLKGGFYASLITIFVLCGLISLIIGFFSNGEVKDNWVIIADLIILVFEIILIFTANYISKNVK